jgi:rod shape determining protein RodA
MTPEPLFGPKRADLPFYRKLREMRWMVVLVIIAIAVIGFAMLYSVSGGDWRPWALRQIIRFAIGLVLMLAVAVVHIRVWWGLAYPIYIAALLLLVVVEIMGEVGMGAQRWIDLGFFLLQPSEVMKIALVLVLARYFHSHETVEIRHLKTLIIPALLVAAPVVLVLRQPDLGTALLIALGGAGMFFLAGAPARLFGIAIGLGLAAIPIGWQFLRDYQKDRVLTFLNPESDPLGAGYHIMQSKIALGSGGLLGRGFLQGTQSHLNFLPEKQTDFIFTMLAEEFGLIGGLILLALYTALFLYGGAIGLQARNQFGRLLALGVTLTLFLYVFINIAMVMGLVPVVGVPLPLVSYGGTAMLTLMIGMGLVLSVHIHRDVTISRSGVVR